MLANINLSIEEGEFVALVGFSGRGKTTLISILAGLVAARRRRGAASRQAGRAAPGPDRGVVFQSYSLMPWLTVSDNIALAVDAVFAKEAKPQRRARTSRSTSSMVGLATPPTAGRPSSPAACASASRWRARSP